MPKIPKNPPKKTKKYLKNPYIVRKCLELQKMHENFGLKF